MAGNVWEWCNDWYHANYYNASPYSNPRGPASGTYRVLRGGSWHRNAMPLRGAFRLNGYAPSGGNYGIGFRLALDSASCEEAGAFRIDNRPVPADFDHDGDVDANDFGLFIACASGPMVPYAAGCEAMDLDDDGDVDHDDFGVFQRCYSREGVPADPVCAG